MKVVSVVGSRPQFVKCAPVAQALLGAGHEHVIVHTGPEYVEAMYADLFARYDLPRVARHLGIEADRPGRETGEVLLALGPVLQSHAPDWVLTYGDTDTTLAAVLTCAKLGLRSAHVEAGLRSYNRAMVQEHNRVAADHTADLLLAPTAGALSRLRAEGLAERARLVGDVLVDVLDRTRGRVAERAPVGSPRPDGDYAVATLQRSANLTDPDRLAAIVRHLADLPVPVLLVTNPRLFRQAGQFGIELRGGSLQRVPPLTYEQMIHTLLGAQGVITDSAGVQKEAFVLGVPCTTLRPETEWPETLYGDWNVLEPDPARLADVALREPPAADRGKPFGAGEAARRIVEELVDAG